MRDRQILHVAVASLTTAAELRAHPQYGGQPVVVVSPGRQAAVLGLSPEAAALGARVGMPEWQVRQVCPEAVSLVARRVHAAPLLRQVTSICLRYTPLVDVVSLDELCSDVTGSLRLFGSAARIGVRLVNEIHQETELEAQAGLSHNRLLARIAAHQARPGRLVEIGESEAPDLLASLPVRALHMLDAAGIAWLAQAGVRRLGELGELPVPFLETRFGALGHLLAEAARGVDASPVPRYEDTTPCAQITAETPVPGETHDLEGMLAHVHAIVEVVAARLQQEHCMARALCLTLGYADGMEVPLRRHLPAFANSTDALYQPVAQMAARAELTGRTVASMRLAVSDLCDDAGAEQLSFSQMPAEARSKARHAPRRPVITGRAARSR